MGANDCPFNELHLLYRDLRSEKHCLPVGEPQSGKKRAKKDKSGLRLGLRFRLNYDRLYLNNHSSSIQKLIYFLKACFMLNRLIWLLKIIFNLTQFYSSKGLLLSYKSNCALCIPFIISFESTCRDLSNDVSMDFQSVPSSEKSELLEVLGLIFKWLYLLNPKIRAVADGGKRLPVQRASPFISGPGVGKALPARGRAPKWEKTSEKGQIWA